MKRYDYVGDKGIRAFTAGVSVRDDGGMFGPDGAIIVQQIDGLSRVDDGFGKGNLTKPNDQTRFMILEKGQWRTIEILPKDIELIFV